MHSEIKNSALRTWVEISKESLVKNFNTIKRIVGTRTLIASVVKANAYGHGIDKVVPILEEAGTNWFAVDSLDEALTLRQMKIERPILVLGYIPKARIKEAVDNDISITLYRDDFLTTINSLNLQRKAKVHLKLETGLNRQGLHLKEFVKLVKEIDREEKIELEGISTHFANIEDTLDPSFAMQQLSRFNKALKECKKEKIKIPYIHCAASAATLLYKNTHFNMVRIGIGMYGLWPSREAQMALSIKKMAGAIKLSPVLTWKSIVAQVKTLKAGESVGYGRTWFSPRKSRIAIIPVGYYDGYDRGLSNNSRVLIRGQFAPVVGRVAMNMITADVTEIRRAKPDNEVILIGKTKKEQISADELAIKIGTINYEIVSRINPNLPRIVV